jgi:pyruvate,water dikinase
MLIFNLKEIPLDYLPLVGGKARGLNTLSNLGLKIASGYVLLDIDLIKDKEELISFYSKANIKNLAVRSSSSQEDGVDLSSAGQYETYLNIDNLSSYLEAIQKCLESCNSSNIKEYRKQFLQSDSKMNIVIQEMVEVFSSGVCFSLDPSGKENNVLIEVVDGLGEALVNGSRSSQAIRIDIANPEFNSIDLLSKEAQKDLFDSAIITRDKLESPSDIEWATTKEMQVIYLQLRPVTTNLNVTINELDTKYNVENDVITNHNIGEMLPGSITPLTISTVVYSIDYGIREMLSLVGVVKKVEDIPSQLIVSNYLVNFL